MVELYLNPLDAIFGSLADPTRRDILRRIATKEMSVTDVAQPYKLTFAAISKHLKVLERAKLITKRKQGREHVVALRPEAVADATEFLRMYEQLWNNRLDSLEHYLSSLPPSHHG